MYIKHPFKEQYYENIKRSLKEYEKCYPDRTKQTALRLIFWNFLYLFQKTKQTKYSRNDDYIRMAFLLGGGYGDYLIFANWLYYFYQRYADKRLKIVLFYHIKSATTIFNYPINNVEICDINDDNFRESDYDIVIQFSKFPKLVKVNKKEIDRKLPALEEYIDICERFYAENKVILDNMPRLDGYASWRSAVYGIKRIQEPDLFGSFHIEEQYRYPIKIQEDENAYLNQYGLNNGYITIHRGWDGTYAANVKAWSFKSCSDLIERIKSNFPQYKVVVIGSEHEQAPPGVESCDLNLIGRTNLEQVKVLLKHAVVHIDNEGGMVHLRHALSGGPSVVMFGPTSERVFGYSENENITSDICRLNCEWLTMDWPKICPRCPNATPCMDGITTQQVIAACHKVIKRRMKQ